MNRNWRTALISAAILLASQLHGTSFADEPDAATKQKLAGKFDRAERESLEAVEDRLKAVRGLFERAKEKTAPFAEEVLGTEGKLRYAAGGAERAAGFVGGLIDQARGKSGAAVVPDSFAAFVRGRFHHHIFAPDDLKREARSAVDAYAATLRRMEEKLIVELAADVDDASLKAAPVPPPAIAERLFDHVEGMVDASVKNASTDFGVMVAKEAGAWVTGDLIAAGIQGMAGAGAAQSGRTDPGTVALSLLAGLAADQLMDGLLQAGGYDAVKTLAAEVRARIEKACEDVIDGDRALTDRYLWLVLHALDDASPRVRRACEDAASLIERNTRLSLRASLTAMHHRRCFQRRTTLYTALLGEHAVPLGRVYLNPEKQPAESVALGFAESCARVYGGAK